MNHKKFIGIDGGASNTRGVLISGSGETLASAIITEGSNLTLNPKKSTDLIINIITKLCSEVKLSRDKIDGIGLGLAGSSDLNGRDYLFGKFDNLNLSHKTIIMNDAEASYEICCPNDFGILLVVGTGVICIGRKDGKVFRQAGKGHDKGDIGSGYWIGKQAILNLTLNETSVIGDRDLEQIMGIFMQGLGIDEDFNSSLEKVYNSDNSIAQIASLAEKIINLSQSGNEIALSIIQEATHAISEYVISISDFMEYDHSSLLIAGSGSIIKNDFFRSSLNDELAFQFSDLKWTFSKLSASYGAAIMVARMENKIIKISDILKGDNYLSA